MDLRVLFVIAASAAFCSAVEDCYEDLDDTQGFDGTGCHSTAYPPQCLSERRTAFYLYTRSTRNSNPAYEVLDRTSLSSISSSTFDPSLNTKFVIHGWTDNTFMEDFQAIKDSLLTKEDCNVVMVDWYGNGPGGNSKQDYDKSRQNIRVVGREVASLANQLNSLGASYGSMHFIGHSLGAHTSGYAGEQLRGQVGRITGLDAAGPDYRGESAECRLDETDAQFVDAIHTDANLIAGMGIMEQVGHADFYPNGGKAMPGCGAFDPVRCDHDRSVKYFQESIESTCSFESIPCNSWNSYENGACGCTLRDPCVSMGYNVATSARGSYYLDTSNGKPFCIN